MGCLKTGGQCILTTPHKKIGDNKIWASDHPPVHLWCFTRKSLSVIAEATSSKILFFNFDNFYKINDFRNPYKTIGKYFSYPVLDEQYNLISPVEVDKMAPAKLLIKI